MGDWEQVVAISGLALVTVLARGMFLWPRRQWRLPQWLESGLRYAPVAALSAIVAPALLMDAGGQWGTVWADGRLAGATVGVLWFRWRRDVLGTIVCGTLVMGLCRWLAGGT